MPASATSRNRKVANRLHRLRYDILHTLAQQIHDEMLAAAVTFAAPPVSMATLQTDIDTFYAAWLAWGPAKKGKHGSHAQHIDLIVAKEALILDIAQEADYVEALAQTASPSNRGLQTVTILLGGMRPKHQASIVGKYNRPANLRQIALKKGLDFGQAWIRWDKPLMGKNTDVPNAYVVYASGDPNNLPFSAVGTVNKTAYTYIGNPNSAVVYIRVRATGALGLGSWSDILVAYLKRV